MYSSLELLKKFSPAFLNVPALAGEGFLLDDTLVSALGMLHFYGHRRRTVSSPVQIVPFSSVGPRGLTFTR